MDNNYSDNGPDGCDTLRDDRKERDVNSIIPRRLSQEQRKWKDELRVMHSYTWDNLVEFARFISSDDVTIESWVIGYMRQCIRHNDYSGFDYRDWQFNRGNP